jgi:hypothetical protein
MKSVLTILTILFFSQTVKSQLTKGNWLVGGNISFASTNYKSEAGQKNTAFLIQAVPNIGYFIADKFVAGLKVNISRQGVKATGTSVYSHYTDANFGPFLRYYLLSTEKQFNIIAEGAYQFGFSKGDVQKTSKSTFSFAFGPAIYFNTSVGLEFLIGYSSSKYTGYTGSNGTVQLGLGFQIHLEKDK